MRKMICAFGCVIALLLAGCQTQLVPPDTITNANQTVKDSVPDSDSASDGNPMNSDVDTNQSDSKNDPGSDTPSGDDIEGAPTSPEEFQREVDLNGNDKSDAVAVVTQPGERKLKEEGSLHGEIEVTHKLPVGEIDLSEGKTVLFHIETKSAAAELKITLTGSETGTILEGSVIGTGDISLEIDTSDEYTVVLENCSIYGVQFTIDYSIGGSK